MSSSREKRTIRKLKIEDLLSDELKREMFVTSGLKYVDPWADIMRTGLELPIEYGGYTKRICDMIYVKQMIERLHSGDFDDAKRSESRQKQMKEFTRTMTMYYNLIFTRRNEKVGYGVLIHFPNPQRKTPERSSGIVLIAKYKLVGGKGDMKFERGRFDDFLVEVRPYIEILGDLYRSVKGP